MLIDCSLMGPERRLHFEVSDIRQAAAFYAGAMNAEEIFRMSASTGEPTRLGMNIGPIGITLGEIGAESDPMTLPRLAAELNTTFVGVILYVPNPEDAARRAIDGGSRIHPAAEAEGPTCGDCPVQVVIDPFGNVWAFAKG